MRPIVLDLWSLSSIFKTKYNPIVTKNNTSHKCEILTKKQSINYKQDLSLSLKKHVSYSLTGSMAMDRGLAAKKSL